MSRLRNLLLAALLAACTACEKPVVLGDGVMAPDPPVQRATTEPPLELNGFRIQPRAEFVVTGKILSRRRYRRDLLAPVVPWDFAMGWGPMSDEANLRGISITQGDRFYFWRAFERRLPEDVIRQTSANMHLVPATADVEAALAGTPAGAIVTLRGKLVDLYSGRRDKHVRTSLTRYDWGPGACEIVYVEAVELVRS